MSKLSRAIEECMQGLSCGPQGDIKASFSFPSGFIGFKGHFPGNPILPGVCKIQAIMCMLRAATRKQSQLKEIKSAKFFTPVSCDEKIAFSVTQLTQDREETVVKALITRQDEKIANIELKVIFLDKKEPL